MLNAEYFDGAWVDQGEPDDWSRDPRDHTHGAEYESYARAAEDDPDELAWALLGRLGGPRP